MAQRRKVGIIYQYNENWIGGTYYIQNLIAALNKLPESERPIIVVLTWDIDDYNKLKDIVDYPYLERRTYSRQLRLYERIINKIGRVVLKKNIFSVYHNDLELVFPASQENRLSPKQELVYWIPDFQEYYLPQFFSEEEISSRRIAHEVIASKARYVVFSSNSAKKDFNTFFPNSSIQQFVIQFAVTHPELSTINLDKYNLPSEYYICSNQFWQHKNHKVVLLAIEKLKRRGQNIKVFFTGREYDYRNPHYFDELKKLIFELSIEDNVAFLGFISRADQLAMMQQATAVIQPSLFEGWSTVIEDAKALNVRIIASDLDVHKEQLNQYPSKIFFPPEDAEILVASILSIVRHVGDSFCYDYQKDIYNYGHAFAALIDEIGT